MTKRAGTRAGPRPAVLGGAYAPRPRPARRLAGVACCLGRHEFAHRGPRAATDMTTTALHRLSAHVGSLRTALALLLLLGLLVLAQPDALGLGLVFAALGLNLVAALVVHPLLRRQLPLLVFHLALLALVLLVGVGRLTKLDGRFELLQGVPFDGRLLEQQAGALYRGDLQGWQLRNEGFTIDYAPGRRRGATRNTVSWADRDGQPQRAVIGDHRPLVIGAHRVYTTSNKGFAPVLRWLPAHGEPVLGAVHLPSYPLNELRQSREWSLPDGRAVWLQLQFDEKNLIAPDAAAQFRVPQAQRLVLRLGEARAELAPGQAWRIDGGTLVYEGLRSWMGYRISHDPTLPWLLAAALTAALALGWHYVLAFRAPGPRAAAALPRGASHA
jgi:ResB-like family